MKSIHLTFLLLTCSVTAPAFGQEIVDTKKLIDAQLSTDELNQGWINLFDGQSLLGWTPAGKCYWQVNDGAIEVREGEIGLLISDVPMPQKYELEFEFRADESTNSGVFLQTPDRPTNPTLDCYELNVAPDSNPFPTGSLVGRKKVSSNETGKLQPQQWHKFVVHFDHGKIDVWLNDKHLYQYVDPKPIKKGGFGLQHNQGFAAFRNVRWRPTESKTLLPAANLEAWITTGTGEGSFTLVDQGSLRVEGGKGQLETKDSFGDFILQLRGRLDNAQTNSGLFFRCIPGESLNGYECQLHQGFTGDDRTKPADGGLGGIFRRQNARVVLGTPPEPFAVTLIAHGPKLATWVNGVQVVSFVDQRPKDKNPRKGLRVDRGPLMIQGHDPTTRITIDALSVTPIDFAD